MTPPTDQERAASHQMARRFNWIHPPPDGDASPASGQEVDAAWDAVKAKMNLAAQGHLAYKGLTNIGITDAEINRFVFVPTPTGTPTPTPTGTPTPAPTGTPTPTPEP